MEMEMSGKGEALAKDWLDAVKKLDQIKAQFAEAQEAVNEAAAGLLRWGCPKNPGIDRRYCFWIRVEGEEKLMSIGMTSSLRVHISVEDRNREKVEVVSTSELPEKTE